MNIIQNHWLKCKYSWFFIYIINNGNRIIIIIGITYMHNVYIYKCYNIYNVMLHLIKIIIVIIMFTQCYSIIVPNYLLLSVLKTLIL